MSAPLPATRFLIGWAVLVMTATTALVLSPAPETAEPARVFQQMVGGLGMGAALPRWEYASYDPRLEAICTTLEFPIPGGYCYSPDHAASVFHHAESPQALYRLVIVNGQSSIVNRQ